MDNAVCDRKNKKRTTEKQYILLKSSMTAFIQKSKHCHKNNEINGSSLYEQGKLHWIGLTDKLNNIGPPYRTIQQWKKVWCDFKRAERRRHFNSTHKVLPHIERKPSCDNQIGEKEIVEENTSETTSSSKLEIRIKSERKDDEQNSQSMYTTHSNEYDNDYSYPDEDSLEKSYADDKEAFMPDESSCISYTYLNKTTPGTPVDQIAPNKHFRSPPPLQPSTTLILDQTMYALQNQMEHQTKILEHFSEISTTMSNLMERQVKAVEKQTEAMHRQAFATERHTSAMHTLIDMIRDKMLKRNS